MTTSDASAALPPLTTTLDLAWSCDPTLPVQNLSHLPIAQVTADRLVGHVVELAAAGRGGSIMTANIDFLARMAHHPELRAHARRASLVVPDGMPLVWAARLRGRPLPGRVTGADLCPALATAAAARGLGVYLLGAAPGVAEQAAVTLQDHAPGLRVVGIASPPRGFDEDPEQVSAVIRDVVLARPAIVFVALGFPKQERISELLREHLPETWFLGCGAALDFLAGAVQRSPRWVQRIGMEWCYRLLQEPRRLFHRYVVVDLPYAVVLLTGALLFRAGQYVTRRRINRIRRRRARTALRPSS